MKRNSIVITLVMMLGLASIDFAYNIEAQSPKGRANLYSMIQAADQPASHCRYCLSPTERSFTFEGGGGSVAVTAPGGCAWTATTEDEFITITSGGTGSGNGIVSYAIEPNTGSSRRIGSISIAGRAFIVLQGVRFNDVPSGHAFYNEIGKLSARGITLGCNTGLYCPDEAVTRQQMAAFIIRALGIFDPPQPSSQRFADVPPSNPFYAFIEELAARQITLGCGGGNYCPDEVVTRQQMAAFIIRALGEFDPPAPATQRFDDVPPSNPFYAFIDRLAALGITLGCGTTPGGRPLFCPTDPVTRGQMAAFLIRAFDQPANFPPSVLAGPDQTITLPSAASLSGLVFDDGLPACGLTFLWSQVSGPGAVTFDDPDAESTPARFSAPGTYVLRLMASDFETTTTDDVTITVNPLDPSNQPPSVNAGPDQTITLPSIADLNGSLTDDGVPSAGALAASWTKVSGPGTVIFSTASGPATTAMFSEAGSYVLRLTGSDSILISSDEVTITVNPDPTPPPPDPETVAPPVDRTAATTIADATEFLYTGPNPIQTGVAPGTINPLRAAVLRGRVKGAGGAPLSNVRISVLDHPELGQTFTRADGWFDIAVNGDDLLTVRYEKNGFIPVQRQQRVDWQEYRVLDDVVMMNYNDRVTHIDLSAAVPIQVARGSTSLDADGARRAVLMFRQGTTAMMILPDGSQQQLTNLHVRATEYTVGPNGPEAMPGSLPPTSAYTYAVEYSVDEAVAAGANSVLFNQPVINYIENFLDFPVGGVVPVGGYDREAVSWMPSANGRVIKILSIASGAAELDTDGDGVADNNAALGITLAERQRLAELYPAGQSLWRVPIDHFSPWDCNWPYVPPSDAESPPPVPPPSPPADDTCEEEGSIIECQNQTLGERVALVGTPFSLNYRSDRVVGNGAAYTMSIPLSGASVPASLRRIELEVSVGGRVFTQSFAALTNQRTAFTWDGRDVYGHILQGGQPVTVRVGFVFPALYRDPSQFPSSFGDYGNSTVVGNGARQEITIWQQTTAKLGGWDAQAQGLGGWSLSAHHAYDPVGQRLYLGDGSRRTASALPAIISTSAGGGPTNCNNTDPCGDGGLATSATLDAQGIAIDGQGNLFIADWARHKVRKVDAAGIITTVAGTGLAGFSGDGGPATQAQLSFPQDVAVDAQGNLFIVDGGNNRIRKVDAAGVITTVAGTGVRGTTGDGGPATQAQLDTPQAVAVAPDGTFFIAEFNSHHIRRVSPAGIITTVADAGDLIVNPSDLAVDGQGNLFITSTHQRLVRRLSPDGRITTVAGGGNSPVDGVPATSTLIGPQGIAVDRQGNLFIADAATRRVRQVNPQGIITSVAGGGALSIENARDGLPATGATMNPQYLAVDEQGSLLISDRLVLNGPRINRIRKVRSVLPGFAGALTITLASEDGSQLYSFDSVGRHLSTVNALTGATVYTLAYDSAGRLTTITDGDGNITMIERNASGQPTAIVAPFGQRTTLSLNGNGYLASIANPAGETTQCGYTNDGLLTTFTDPMGHSSTMTYDAQGRLTRDENAAGGFFSLTRTESASSFTVSLTSALNRATSYLIERLMTGEERRVNTFPGGLQNSSNVGTNSSRAITFSDGAMTTLLQEPDPRFGMQSPLNAQLTFTTPGGLTYTRAQTRAVTLSNPNDPLSLDTLTDTFNINGRTYISLYTGATRTFTITTPAGRRTIITIDAQGRITQQQFANLNPISYVYDLQGRLASATSGAGVEARSFSFSYNNDGYLSTATDPLGRTQSYVYDPAGRVTQQTLPDGRMISYAYDANGNTTAITPPGRPAHISAYTSIDLVSNYTPPDAGSGATSTRYTYDADRLLTSTTLPNSQAIISTYDSQGRLSALTTPGGQYIYAYNATTGNLTSTTGPGGTILSYTYDGSLETGTTWSGAISGSVARTYDNNFRINSRSVNGGNTINFFYDNDNLLTSAGALTLSRDAQNGLLTATTLGNVTDAVSYNGFGEVTSYDAAYNTTSIYSVQFTRDKLGLLIRKTETIAGMSNTYAYSYDQAGRLTSVQKNDTTTTTYTYDSNSNRLSYTGPGPTVNGVYDNQDRMIGYGTAVYTYTANGELMSKTASGQLTTYQYDAAGNLSAVTLPDGTQIEYLIDGENRRIAKKVNGAVVQAFLYQDGLRPVAELDGDNNVIGLFVYATQSNVPDYIIRNGVTYRIISDHLGSPRLVVDVATGTIAQRMDYDEFGVVSMDTNPGFQPFGFAGGLYDIHTRLVRFGVRDYDAEVGRWTAKDPLLFGAGDPNLYSYVGNSPQNGVDPSGQYAPPPIPTPARPLAGAGSGSRCIICFNPQPKGLVFTPNDPNVQPGPRPSVPNPFRPLFPGLDRLAELLGQQGGESPIPEGFDEDETEPDPNTPIPFPTKTSSCSPGTPKNPPCPPGLPMSFGQTRPPEKIRHCYERIGGVWLRKRK